MTDDYLLKAALSLDPDLKPQPYQRAMIEALDHDEISFLPGHIIYRVVACFDKDGQPVHLDHITLGAF